MSVGIISDLVLLRPYWLLALLPILGVALWARHRGQQGQWTALIDPALLPVLQRLGWLQAGGTGSGRYLPSLAAAVMALALSGPALPREGGSAYRALDPLVLLLDLSPSLMAEERPRVDLQAAAAALVVAAEGRPVGILVYAADAYLASAPSTDQATALSLISVLGPDIMPVAGSRPDMALSMARDLFAVTDVEAATGATKAAGGSIAGADLVLLSDGGGVGPRAIEEAARLKTDGARVWVLGLNGAAAAPKVPPGSLEALANAGGGAAFAAAEVAQLSEAVARARVARLAREDVAAQSLRDLGPYLLVLALLLLWPLFRRRR